MPVTAADYAWFEDRFPGLSEAYCLTLARGLEPQEFLARVGATRQQRQLAGVNAILEPSMQAWDRFDGEALLIAATAVPDGTSQWTLGVESNGFLGVTPQVIVPASKGTRIVSHFQNIEAVSRFFWIEDGDIRLQFSPLEPAYREGSTPDAVLDAMLESGFDPDPDSEDDENCVPAALALAEHLTGVRLTPELLDQATYLSGIAPVRAG